MEGIDSCNEPSTMQPSSALRRACSQAFLAISASNVPPTRPWASGCVAVSHVFTARLVLASTEYVWPDAYMVCKALSSVVVDTCADCWAADRAAPTVLGAFEYCEYLFAIFKSLCSSEADRALQKWRMRRRMEGETCRPERLSSWCLTVSLVGWTDVFDTKDVNDTIQLWSREL